MAGYDRVDPVIMGHVLAQHRELHEQLTAVRHAFSASAGTQPDRAAIVHELLGTLREHLRQHFRQEEAGGFMEESLARMPRLARAARDVIGQHPGLLVEADRLIAALPTTHHQYISVDAGALAIESLAAHLLDHERQENAVVQDGYNEDLGLG
ncbi:MAG: hypothetical protein ACK5SI_05490 [Planctomycetia bacterium]